MSEGRKKERKAMAPNLECRMYESRYPAGGMAVMIQVKTIAATGAYVSLLEYNNIMGKILFLELSRRRIRSVSSLIKVGRIEPMRVLRVDKEKGRIDLSKRRVSEEDIQSCKERYNKSKLVHSIMRHVAETSNIDLEELYVQIGWPLYRKYGHAFEAFKIVATDPDSVLSTLPRKIKQVGPDGRKVTKVVPAVSEEVKDSLVKNIRRRMNPQPQPQPLKIRADIEMKCFQFDGVLHIKVFVVAVSNKEPLLFSASTLFCGVLLNYWLWLIFQSILSFCNHLVMQEAMRKAEAAGNVDCPVKIKLVAPPLYVLTTQTLDKEQGILVLNNAIASCTESIERHKGELVVKEAPRAQIRTVQQGNMQNRMTTAGSKESEDDMPLRQRVRTTASTPVFKQPTQQTNPIPPPQPKTTSSPQTEPISTSSQVETQPDLNLSIQPESISPPQTEPEPITQETQTLDPGSDTILDIQPLASFRPISPPSTQPISSPPPSPSPSPHHTEPEITTESILEDDIVITSKIVPEVIQNLESEPTTPDSHSTQTIPSSPTISLPSDTLNQQATLNQTQPNTETQTQPSCNLNHFHPIPVNRTQTVPLYRGPNCSLPLPNHHIFPTFERFMNQQHEQLEIEQQIERDRALSVHTLLAMEDYYAEWYNVNEWFESHKQQQLQLTRRLLAAPAWRKTPSTPAFWEPEPAPAPVVPETPPPTSSSDLIAQSSAFAQSSHSDRIELDVLDRLVEDNREFKQFMVSSSKKQEELANMLKLLLEKVRRKP